MNATNRVGAILFLALVLIGVSLLSIRSTDAVLLPNAPSGSMGADFEAGTISGNVAYSYKAAWTADINGDGRADYVYNKDGTREYWVLLANQAKPFGDGSLRDAKQAGSRNSNNDVGYDGKAQWMADVNGDGRADYVYNRNNKYEYWVMLARSDGTFETDKNAGSRNSNNKVGWSGDGEWMADVNGDGRADYIYNRDKYKEYWVMLANADGTFQTDKNAGSRNSSNDVGEGGYAQWMADVNGDGRADYLYNKNGSKEYWVMLAKTDGTFQTDQKAGTRNNDVGYSGKAQWLMDVSGDGRADFVYNRDPSKEYWVMVAQPDGTFAADENWGDRNCSNNVQDGINGQGFADLNGDGKVDFFYNRDGSKDYWAMLSDGESFETDQYWGQRKNNIGLSGYCAFLIDLNGDGLADLIYNDAANIQNLWVMLSANLTQAAPAPVSRTSGPVTFAGTSSARLRNIQLLDVWGQGYIKYGDIIAGFQDAYHLDRKDQVVSNGPNMGQPIQNLVPVDNFATTQPVTFPIEDGAVQIMTLMSAPIEGNLPNEMYRTLNKNDGIVILYGFEDDNSMLQAFERVFVTEHGFVNLTSKATLQYPFNQITITPVRVYGPRNVAVTLSLGKGGNVGGAGRSDSSQNQFSGGGLVHDEL